GLPWRADVRRRQRTAELRGADTSFRGRGGPGDDDAVGGRPARDALAARRTAARRRVGRAGAGLWGRCGLAVAAAGAAAEPPRRHWPTDGPLLGVLLGARLVRNASPLIQRRASDHRLLPHDPWRRPHGAAWPADG